jgi:hypothetical protein
MDVKDRTLRIVRNGVLERLRTLPPEAFALVVFGILEAEHQWPVDFSELCAWARFYLRMAREAPQEGSGHERRDSA